MKRFFGQIIASIIGSFIGIGALFAASFFGFIALLIALGNSEIEEASHLEKSILTIQLDRALEDAPSYQDSADAIIEYVLNENQHPLYLYPALRAIHHAKSDDAIAGIFITGNPCSMNYGSGYPAVTELRKALENFF